MLHLLFYLLLIIALLGSLALLVVNLPGLWLMALSAVVYSLLVRPIFSHPSFRVLLLLIGLAFVAEVIDFFAAGAGAKRAGASARGLWGAIIGGIVGAIVGSFLLPLILTLVGVCAGTFIGAFIGEVSRGQELKQSARIGAHATVGRLAGTMVKMCFGVGMILLTLIAAWPFGGVASVTVGGSGPATFRMSAPPASSPSATQPATGSVQ